MCHVLENVMFGIIIYIINLVNRELINAVDSMLFAINKIGSELLICELLQ